MEIIAVLVLIPCVVWMAWKREQEDIEFLFGKDLEYLNIGERS